MTQHECWSFRMVDFYLGSSLGCTMMSRVSVGTWNVGGKPPPDDLDLQDWLDTCEPADIYVFG
jgi:hypothetical protein